MSTAKYRATHREQARALAAAWRAKNPDRHRKASREYARAHSAELTIKRREAKRTYYLAHRDEYRRRTRAWWLANRERAHDYEHAHRARKLGNGGAHTATEWREKIALFGGCCAYCGESRPLERDHIVPLTRGGTNDIRNIVPACRSCNARKHNKTAEEFLALKAVA